MAYFDCVMGSGAGGGIPLIVTCASAFAGLTISCTDGTTTLTDTCPNTSPYEVNFSLPNGGTWTISGTISGQTYTEIVTIDDFECVLQTSINITVDVYSAASDTVSYTGLDNQIHTITTDSSGHGTATIAIIPNGSTFTFVSSVAKDTIDLSTYYSKNIHLTSNTSAIYVCPDGAVYWYGYKRKTITNTNYMSASYDSTSRRAFYPQYTENTNNIYTYYKATNGSTSCQGSIFIENVDVGNESATVVKCAIDSAYAISNNYLGQISLMETDTEANLFTKTNELNIARYSSGNGTNITTPTILTGTYTSGKKHLVIYHRMSLDSTFDVYAYISAIWLE